MAVRDVFWGCPLCRAPGAIRRSGRRERCVHCGAEYRRGSAATIVARTAAGTEARSAGEWLRALGPITSPPAGRDGRILGPETVRVKRTTGQRPLYYGAGFLGWIETYSPTVRGMLELRLDGLHFTPAKATHAEHWALEQLTGLQPASSTIQIGFRERMTSVKFVEGSVRLWMKALGDLLHEHYRRAGYDLVELQPHIRTCPVTTQS